MPGPEAERVKATPVPDEARAPQPWPDERGRSDVPRELHVARDTDFAARLKRLAPNHPSSPLRDQAPRKPDSAARTEFDSPTEPAQDAPSSPLTQDLENEDKARVDPDGSWHWKGLDLTPDAARFADVALAKCRQAEGRDAEGKYGDRGLTPAMRRIDSELEHGRLVGETERYALKSPDRFKEKLAKLIDRYPNADMKNIAQEIHDGIRYTFVCEFESYTEGVDLGHALLIDAGYERIETKPSWHTDEYKGVNSRWRDPDSGVMFEVQFHTQESWEAKQTTHDAYEKIGSPSTPIPEIEQIRAYQREISTSVLVPRGAFDIQPYKSEA